MISVISVIAGFQDPTSGDVLLEGKSLLAVPSHKRNIGMIFQRCGFAAGRTPR